MDPVERLQVLAGLRASGDLTDEEFESLKRGLLDEISQNRSPALQEPEAREESETSLNAELLSGEAPSSPGSGQVILMLRDWTDGQRLEFQELLDSEGFPNWPEGEYDLVVSGENEALLNALMDEFVHQAGWSTPQGRNQPGVSAPRGRDQFTVATHLALWLAAAISGVAGLLNFLEASRFQQWRDSPAAGVDALESAQDMSNRAEQISRVTGAVLLVLLVIWLYRARKAADRFGGTGTSWTPGWAVGGWFIPLANLFIPKLVLNEVERLSSADAGEPPIEGRWRQVRLRPDGWIFWLGMIAGIVGAGFGQGAKSAALVTASGFDADTYHTGLQTVGLALLVLSGSAVAGALMIGRLGEQLNRPLPGSHGSRHPATTQRNRHLADPAPGPDDPPFPWGSRDRDGWFYGWLTDPTGRYEKRYHDGSGWTDHVANISERRQTRDSQPVDPATGQ